MPRLPSPGGALVFRVGRHRCLRVQAPSGVVTYRRPLWVVRLPETCGKVARSTFRKVTPSDSGELRSCPRFAQELRFVSEIGQIGRCWLRMGEISPTFGQHLSIWADVSQVWPSLAKLGQHLANSGPNLASVGRCWPGFGQCGPTLPNYWPT